MMTPIFDQLAAIRVYTAGVTKSNHDYNTYPFAATHVAHCQGTCGGWVVVDHHNPSNTYCHPCRQAAKKDQT